jgi:hypothetical protein
MSSHAQTCGAGALPIAVGGGSVTPFTFTMLDPEDWKIASEAYAEHPLAAFTLANCFISLKEDLLNSRDGKPDACG